MNISDLNGHFPILVAEDDPIARKILEKTLIKEGHEVVSVENGRKAFDLFKERFFPIILTEKFKALLNRRMLQTWMTQLTDSKVL